MRERETRIDELARNRRWRRKREENGCSTVAISVVLRERRSFCDRFVRLDTYFGRRVYRQSCLIEITAGGFPRNRGSHRTLL